MKKSTGSEISGYVLIAGSLAAALVFDSAFWAGALLIAAIFRWWDAKHQRLHEAIAEIKERLPK